MPRTRQTIAATCLLELRTVGLLLPSTAPLAGICLAVLLMATLLANVKAPVKQVMIGSKTATPLWFRMLAHVVLQ